MDGSHISFDATTVRADADKIIEKTFNDTPTQKTSRGNRELPLSKSDPDARWTKRPGEGAVLGYNAHIATDSKEKIITNIDVTPANIPGHDKMIPLIDEQVDNHKFKIDDVSADSEYGAGHVREALEKRSISAYIPLRNRGMKGGTSMFKYEDFKYDKECDIVACPAGKAMHFMKQVPDARVSARCTTYSKQCLIRIELHHCNHRRFVTLLFHVIKYTSLLPPRFCQEAPRLHKIFAFWCNL